MEFTRKNYSDGKEYDCDDTVMGGVASLKIVGFADCCQKCSWDNVRKHLTSSWFTNTVPLAIIFI